MLGCGSVLASSGRKHTWVCATNAHRRKQSSESLSIQFESTSNGMHMEHVPVQISVQASVRHRQETRTAHVSWLECQGKCTESRPYCSVVGRRRRTRQPTIHRWRDTAPTQHLGLPTMCLGHSDETGGSVVEQADKSDRDHPPSRRRRSNQGRRHLERESYASSFLNATCVIPMKQETINFERDGEKNATAVRSVRTGKNDLVTPQHIRRGTRI